MQGTQKTNRKLECKGIEIRHNPTTNAPQKELWPKKLSIFSVFSYFSVFSVYVFEQAVIQLSRRRSSGFQKLALEGPHPNNFKRKTEC